MSDRRPRGRAGRGGRGRREADAIVEENEEARIAGLRVSLAVLALMAVLALFFTRGIPTVPVGHDPESTTGV